MLFKCLKNNRFEFNMKNKHKRIVIKVGSNVVANAEGLPDHNRLQHLCEQIATLQKQGIEVILISSGAVASGRSLITLPSTLDTISKRQVLAAVGQVKLIAQYAEILSQYKLLCAQILVTKEDFRDRLHYLNMKNCFAALLQEGVLPIINENDVISVSELMFTDNDELAGLLATMLEADALLVLSNVDGLYDGLPSDPTSKVIPKVTASNKEFLQHITTTKSEFGRGGMASKAAMAKKMARLGTAVYIANGLRENIILNIFNGKAVCTLFEPIKKASNKKRWIAQAGNAAKGKVTVNFGALDALQSEKATSLLPIGILNTEGEYRKGDIVTIIDPKSHIVGIGIAEYGFEKLKELIGQKNQKAFIHYDYLFMENK